MKKTQARLFLFIFAVITLAAILSLNVYAVPTNPFPRQVTQANGTEITVTAHGDEFFSWTEDSDGYVVAYNKDGKNWHYAEIEDGQIMPGAEIVGSQSLARRFTAKITREDLEPLIDNVERFDYSQFGQSNLRRSAVTPKTNQKILLLLIEFDNMPLIETEQYWYNQYFDTTPGAKSVVNYYKDMSAGLDIFSPANTTNINTGGTYFTRNTLSSVAWAHTGVNVTISQSIHNGVVKVRLHMNHPVPVWNNSDTIARAIVELAVKAINDNSAFDFNVFGDDLHIATILAGGEAAAGYNPGGQIWGHAGNFDGRIIGRTDWLRYMAYGEMHNPNNVIGLGTAVHELGHTLGLPDLYDTTYQSAGIGSYSVMAGGNWGQSPDDIIQGQTPTAFDAWSKAKLGYVNPTEVTSNEHWRDNINSFDANDYSAYNVLKVTNYSLNSTQYFLVENRQFSSWDKGFWGWGICPKNDNHGGIMIYHVDESVYNNDNWRHKIVDVEEADGSELLNGYSFWGMPQPYDHFFHVDKFNIFNTTTTPNTNFHSGETQNIPSGIQMRVNSIRGSAMQIEIGVGSFTAVTNITEVPTITTVGSTRLTGIVTPIHATNRTILWTVKNSGTTGAIISDGNTLKTKAPGNVIITATIINGIAIGVNYTQDFTITVNPVPVTSVTLNKTAITLANGRTETLTANVNPSDASNPNVTWSSSNTSVATVDNGIITAVASLGTAVITVTTVDGSYSATCTVSVVEAVRITTAEELAAITTGFISRGSYYILENDINLTTEWIPINNFFGTFDGQGHSINNLYILESSNRQYAGLFGSIITNWEGATVTIKNLTVNIGNYGVTANFNGTDPHFLDETHAGGLIGHYRDRSGILMSTLIIENCNVTGGNVSAAITGVGRTYAGGLIGGINSSGIIENCYTTGNIFSTIEYAGGLIGTVSTHQGTIIIKNCYATGNVSAPGVGGLIGGTGTWEGFITIQNCYATGNVLGIVCGGGLIGNINNSNQGGAIIIENSYATGDVSLTSVVSYNESSFAGGLIGRSMGSLITILNCYAIGDVSAVTNIHASFVGGLVGYLNALNGAAELAIENSYATGHLYASSPSPRSAFIGGLVGGCNDEGYSRLSIIISCFDTDTTGATKIVGNDVLYSGTAEALTSEQMRLPFSFVGWDFDEIWAYKTDINNGYPILRVFHEDIDILAFAILDNITIDGTVGTAIPTRTISIQLIMETSTGLLSIGDNISDWFNNLPEGLNATVANSWSNGMNITISGTPTTTSTAPIAITIPAEFLTSGKAIDVIENPNARWNITPPTISVTGVSMNKNATTLAVGNIETLTVTVTPDNAANKGVIWSSSNESIATINDGLITAISEGTATITVTTVDGDFIATCIITVISNECAFCGESSCVCQAFADSLTSLGVVTGDMIKGEATGKTVDSIKANLNGAKVYREDDKGELVEVKDTDPIGTGMIIKNGKEEIIVVIKGDVTGNGNPDINDAQTFLEHLVGNNPLTGAYEKAAEDFVEESALKSLRAFLNFVMK